MMFDATTALFSLPLLDSHKDNKFLIVYTKNGFSSPSGKHPDNEPIAQQILFKLSNDHSEPSI